METGLAPLCKGENTKLREIVIERSTKFCKPVSGAFAANIVDVRFCSNRNRSFRHIASRTVGEFCFLVEFFRILLHDAFHLTGFVGQAGLFQALQAINIRVPARGSVSARYLVHGFNILEDQGLAALAAKRVQQQCLFCVKAAVGLVE